MKRMKGGRKIIRGAIVAGTTEKIQVFDGKFTTGYKVVDLQVMSNFPASGDEIILKLTTERKTNYGFINMSDTEEIAWFNLNTPYSSGSGGIGNTHHIIDEDNMIVQDFWVNAYSTTDNKVCEYYIVLEKYEFSAWDGAATMVRNQSQAGPSA